MDPRYRARHDDTGTDHSDYRPGPLSDSGAGTKAARLPADLLSEILKHEVAP